MGYDAFVRCNCYRDGKSTRPPVSPRKWHLDTTDGYIQEDADLTDREQSLLRDWELHGCEHVYQRYADERVGNIWAVGEARYLIQTYFTEDEIPVLYDMLPHCNEAHVRKRGGGGDGVIANLGVPLLHLFHRDSRQLAPFNKNTTCDTLKTIHKDHKNPDFNWMLDFSLSVQPTQHGTLAARLGRPPLWTFEQTAAEQP